ncbi:discoidin domain-containing protein [Peribacillus butanolivorans]|uniref:discoidin domain-containing protein n=1 Tax=Peribacillus butanolivorans TaxID=421767 RepID=UPI002E226D0F|nr:discoidin domain-containing protein [Peribacillus butanolivorans]
MKRILSITVVLTMIFVMLSTTTDALANASGDKLVKIDNMQPVYGQTITASVIINHGSMGKNLTFQWQVQESRISDQYINVKSGGTSKSYTVTLNDIGKKLRVVVGLPSNGDKKTSLPTNAVLNANPLIASMKFDNNLKDDANQENLEGKGNYSYVDGVLPGTKALHLESGDGNYVGTKHSLNFGNDSFTISFWYKGDTKNNQVILSNKDFSNGSNAGWAIYTSANSVNMNLGFPTAKEKNISFGRNAFDASDWRYVTYAVDRNKMLASLYIDGYEMAETTLKLGTLDTSNPLKIGVDGLGNLGGNSFDIADLMVWKGVLSSDVVQANYNSYAVNKVEMNALNDTISEAKTIIAGGLGNGFSETDFDYLKKVFTTANTVATTQKEKLFTQETINYYERELTNAIFIYQKSNKTATPADLNMIVNSDTEISGNPAAIARVEDDFRKSLKIFSQADVMLIPGDVTGGNNAIEYLWMNELTKVYNKLKDESLFDNIALYLVRGNHDMGGAEKLIPVGSAGAWNESTKSYDNNFFNDAYRVKIKGYNLVVFDGNYDNNNTSGKAKNFLDQIKKEADYDPTKPIFVSSHFPISGTNWGSAWSTAGSNNVGKYIADNNLSQVVYLSGHTHYDPTDERSLYQGAASYFDAGSTSYSSYIDGGPSGGYIEGAYINYNTTPRISNFIEVYGTKVIIKHYNLSTEEFVGIPSVVYVGEGKDAFTYSKSDTRELIAPQFDEGITINSFKNNELTFTMKQANDNVRVLEYNVQLINKLTGEVDKSFNSLSLPLDKPFDEHREYKITGLSPITPYTLRVFAADSMYNRSSQDIDITPQGVNLESITAPADKTGVAIGAAKTADALGLPKTVSLVTDGGGGDAKVTWDVDASNYDPAVTTVQTFTVNGAVTLPTGVANPNNVPLTTSIKVTVNKIPQSQMTATATSQETSGENSAASMAIDGNPETLWHTKWDKSDVLPQSITLNLGGAYKVNKVTYLPRQSGLNGNITSYNVYVSTDGVTFTKVASGSWANNNVEKEAIFDSTDASYVKLEATAGVNGWASAAEISVLATKTVKN